MLLSLKESLINKCFLFITNTVKGILAFLAFEKWSSDLKNLLLIDAFSLYLISKDKSIEYIPK
jgi:hypothetical protein